MDTNNPNDLHTFTLCSDDWQIIIDALYEATSERLTRADTIGLESTYGAILYNDAQKIRAVADYIEFFLPENND
jgi:predicted metal-dependent RNase